MLAYRKKFTLYSGVGVQRLFDGYLFLSNAVCFCVLFSHLSLLFQPFPLNYHHYHWQWMAVLSTYYVHMSKLLHHIPLKCSVLWYVVSTSRICFSYRRRCLSVVAPFRRSAGNVWKYLCLDISACGQQSHKVSLFLVFGLTIYILNALSGRVAFAVLFIRLPFVAVPYSSQSTSSNKA